MISRRAAALTRFLFGFWIDFAVDNLTLPR